MKYILHGPCQRLDIRPVDSVCHFWPFKIYSNLFKMKLISVKLWLIPWKSEKLRGNAVPGLIVYGKKKKKEK